MVLWLSVAILLIATLAGLAFAVVRGLQFWRDFKRSSKTVGAELDRINAVSASIERHSAAAATAAGRLQSAAERLAVSRAQLNTQLAAVRHARAQVRRVFWFVPGI